MMPEDNVIVLILPVGHGLEYCSKLLERLRAGYLLRGLRPIFTDGVEGSNDYAIEFFNPTVVYAVGHGECCVYTCECMTPYISTIGSCEKYTCSEELRLEFFNERYVHLLSCHTGKLLGHKLIEHGARAYVGYSDEFIYGVAVEGFEPPPASPPNPMADFYSFVDCDMEIERGIMNGRSIRASVESARRKALNYIYRYSYGDWRDWTIAPYASMFLEHNFNCLTCLGDLDWTPLKPKLAVSIAPRIAPIALGLLPLSFELFKR